MCRSFLYKELEVRSGDGEGVTCAQNVSLRSTNLASVWRECRFSAD